MLSILKSLSEGSGISGWVVLELEKGKNRRDDMVGGSTFPEYALTRTGCVAGVDGGSDWEEVGLRVEVVESWRGLSGPASALEVIDADADARGHLGNVDAFIARLMQDSAEGETPLYGVGFGFSVVCCMRGAYSPTCNSRACMGESSGNRVIEMGAGICSASILYGVGALVYSGEDAKTDPRYCSPICFSTVLTILTRIAHHESVPGMYNCCIWFVCSV